MEMETSLITSRRKTGIAKWLITPARGGNLKDAIIAVVVIAAVLILVFQLGTFLWGLYQNSATQTEVTTMLEQSRKLKSRAGYTGASMATLRAVNGIPASVDRTGDVYYNRYGGTYALAPARTNGSAFNNSVAMTLTGVSEGGCGDLAQMFLNAGESIYSVTIGSTAMLTANVTTGTSTAATLIGTQCDGGDKTLIITTSR
ncbi:MULTISPECIES: type 4 pilus major pilin [Pectobacterium]|nr:MULTISPECIES: type 4 pilus major pilin [Pectobacterium]MCQ8234575.1 pilus assembly protein PilX [Pectobacterium carotovorum]